MNTFLFGINIQERKRPKIVKKDFDHARQLCPSTPATLKLPFGICKHQTSLSSQEIYFTSRMRLVINSLFPTNLGK